MTILSKLLEQTELIKDAAKKLGFKNIRVSNYTNGQLSLVVSRDRSQSIPEKFAAYPMCCLENWLRVKLNVLTQIIDAENIIEAYYHEVVKASVNIDDKDKLAALYEQPLDKVEISVCHPGDAILVNGLREFFEPESKSEPTPPPSAQNVGLFNKRKRTQSSVSLTSLAQSDSSTSYADEKADEIFELLADELDEKNMSLNDQTKFWDRFRDKMVELVDARNLKLKMVETANLDSPIFVRQA